MDKVDKPKKGNTEKRKQKSRDAARNRRSRESDLFDELSERLPIDEQTVASLDKTSVMRLAVTYLKMEHVRALVPAPLTEGKVQFDLDYLAALDGFLMIFSTNGDIVYITENVQGYLGITQIDLMGQSVYDYSHPCDHEDFRDVFEKKNERAFFARMKCTITNRGKSVNLRSASYKVLHFSGHFIADDATNARYFIAIARAIPHPSNIEIPLDKKAFLSKHYPNMKFTYADEKMLDVLGYTNDDLTDQSIYNYYHALDGEKLSVDYKNLFLKGQCETSEYRFLAKYGGYVWVVTQATVLYDKYSKAQSVVCVHNVLSNIENPEQVYSHAQQLARDNQQINVANQQISNVHLQSADSIANNSDSLIAIDNALFNDVATIIDPIVNDLRFSEADIIIDDVIRCCKTNDLLATHDLLNSNDLLPADEHLHVTVDELRSPQTATLKIFTPRTEDMNKGFLIFSDDEPGLTLIKDEPEDLTHLAPTAGGVCVPLENTYDNSNDMRIFNELIFDDHYVPLDDLSSSIDKLKSDVTYARNASYSDAFNLSSDTSNASSASQNVTPNAADHLSSFLSLQMVDDFDAAELLNDTGLHSDDPNALPLLMTDDLMWGGSNELVTNHACELNVASDEKIEAPVLDIPPPSPPLREMTNKRNRMLLMTANNAAIFDNINDTVVSQPVKSYDGDSKMTEAAHNALNMTSLSLAQLLSVNSISDLNLDVNDRSSLSPSNALISDNAKDTTTTSKWYGTSAKCATTSPPIVNAAQKRAMPEADRATKRAKIDLTAAQSINLNTIKTNKDVIMLNNIKLTANKEKLSTELLQQLISNDRCANGYAKVNDEDKWKGQSDSVLMNLLVNGCDVSHGYICIIPTRNKMVKTKI